LENYNPSVITCEKAILTPKKLWGGLFH